MNLPFAKQDDIRHVLHALKFLKPGGHLVAIMSASTMFRANKLATDFRELVASMGEPSSFFPKEPSRLREPASAPALSP
jgi:hypothetical protein